MVTNVITKMEHPTHVDIDEAYNELLSNIVQTHIQDRILTEKRRARATKYNDHVLSGNINGKNEIERTAQAAELMSSYDRDIATLQTNVDAGKNDIEYSRINLDRIKTHLRLMEIENVGTD